MRASNSLLDDLPVVALQVELSMFDFVSVLCSERATAIVEYVKYVTLSAPAL
jgi:hypothetical protein